jgi:LAS superfamily LD-carboxypeptidase LdcB
MVGNNGVTYSVVKIIPSHLSNPSIYLTERNRTDNTMTTATACAFDKMATAAKAAGVTITITSGFQSIGCQEYLWYCSETERCNKGQFVPHPGTSPHGRGAALTLKTNCVAQIGSSPKCGADKVYPWLYSNAHNYGFIRTMQALPWHWEYVGSGATRAPYS